MIHIDGAQKSGSGTIVRFGVGLAALLGEELRLTNIRAKREKPGLRPQHLKAVKALQQICQGTLDGGEIGSKEIRFKLGRLFQDFAPSAYHMQHVLATLPSTGSNHHYLCI